VANVLQDLEVGWEVFELLAHFRADARALVATGRAGLVVEVVLDLNPFQALGQLLAAVHVAVLDATSRERFARLGCDARFIQRQLFEELAKE
jgi:molybdopterin-guanine dinucleotide biosynthesis protein A